MKLFLRLKNSLFKADFLYCSSAQNKLYLLVMKDEQLFLLIQKAKEKDQKAQTKLINVFWVDVFSFVMKKVGDENDADEITVNVFSKVLSKLDMYDPHFQFKTWILTIAQNTIIDFWRKKSRENQDVTENLDEVKNQYAKSPEELMISAEAGTTLSTQENNSIQIKIHPNPASKKVFIEGLKSKNVSVEIISFEGRKIVEIPKLNNDNSIDVSSLSPGVYFMNILDENQKTYTQKLIIK
jgi:DNA-directed RNA polymerase specialized sigma24 family protein